jgi:hypothetical protein
MPVLDFFYHSCLRKYSLHKILFIKEQLGSQNLYLSYIKLNLIKRWYFLERVKRIFLRYITVEFVACMRLTANPRTLLILYVRYLYFNLLLIIRPYGDYAL